MKVKLRTSVFVPAFGIVLLAGVAGLVDNQLLISFFQGIFEGAYENFGWLYQLITLALFILCLVLMFSKMGDVRIGGKDAKPKYSFWSWFAMSLTGGIGASLVSSSISQLVVLPVCVLRRVRGEHRLCMLQHAQAGQRVQFARASLRRQGERQGHRIGRGCPRGAFACTCTGRYSGYVHRTCNLMHEERVRT